MIRDEVVEAAARAAHKAGSQYNDIAWECLPSPLQKHYWFMAVAAIQAAAPHMQCEACSDACALGFGADECSSPYRPTA